MEIIACPKCGSRNIFQGTLGDGVLTGYTSRQVCNDCGFQGMPLIFKSEKDYIKFLENITNESKMNNKENDDNNKTEKVTSTKSIKRPIGISILSIMLILQALFSLYLFNLNWIYVFVPLWVFAYYLIILSISAIILPYGFMRGRSWSYFLGGLLFGFSIPIGLIFLYYLTRPHVKKYFGKE